MRKLLINDMKLMLLFVKPSLVKIVTKTKLINFA